MSGDEVDCLLKVEEAAAECLVNGDRERRRTASAIVGWNRPPKSE